MTPAALAAMFAFAGATVPVRGWVSFREGKEVRAEPRGIRASVFSAK